MPSSRATALTCKRTAPESRAKADNHSVRHRNDVCANLNCLPAKQVTGINEVAPALVHCLGQSVVDEGHLKAGCPEGLLQPRFYHSPAGSFQLYSSLAGLASGHAPLQYKLRAASSQATRSRPLSSFTPCGSLVKVILNCSRMLSQVELWLLTEGLLTLNTPAVAVSVSPSRQASSDSGQQLQTDQASQKDALL